MKRNVNRRRLLLEFGESPSLLAVSSSLYIMTNSFNSLWLHQCQMSSKNKRSEYESIFGYINSIHLHLYSCMLDECVRSGNLRTDHCTFHVVSLINYNFFDLTIYSTTVLDSHDCWQYGLATMRIILLLLLSLLLSLLFLQVSNFTHQNINET